VPYISGSEALNVSGDRRDRIVQYMINSSPPRLLKTEIRDRQVRKIKDRTRKGTTRRVERESSGSGAILSRMRPQITYRQCHKGRDRGDEGALMRGSSIVINRPTACLRRAGLGFLKRPAR